MTTAALLDALERAQKRHRRKVAALADVVTELDRRRRTVAKLERRIADMERRLAGPRADRAGENAAADGPLRPALLLFNPSAGPDREDNAERLARIVSRLRVHGVEARVGIKTSGKAVRRMAREVAEAGEGLVIVAAGDGTLQDVASRLVGSDVTLGIVPVGTMNNLARSLGIPEDIDAACALIGMGTTRRIDLGRVAGDGRAHVEYFFDVAGVGLLPLLAHAGQSAVKKRWRLFPRAARRVLETEPKALRVEIDEVVLEPHTHVVTVSNAPLAGDRRWCAPDAKMDDGWLDVSVYDGMGEAALIAHVAALGGDDPPRVPTWRAKKVRIVSDEPLPTSTDMSIAKEQVVVEVTVVPGALNVIVGDGPALTVPVSSVPVAIPERLAAAAPGDAAAAG